MVQLLMRITRFDVIDRKILARMLEFIRATKTIRISMHTQAHRIAISLIA